jgi:serine/threonine protein phosphatase PrpC
MSTEYSPKLKLKFETGAATHVGKVRKANEDSYIVMPELGFWAVADGVGGHEAGQLASQTLTNELATMGPSVSASDQLARFQDRVLRGNDRIRQIVEERGGGMMGTTVAAILIFDMEFACVWSGDSRVYRVRDNKIEQISHDHSEVQELIDQGVIKPEEAGSWPRRNIITIFDDPDVEIRQGEILPGDVFLVCSDGLTGHVADDEILTGVIDERSQDACDALIERTLERGATDNVSVIVVRCHRAERTNFLPGTPAESTRGTA